MSNFMIFLFRGFWFSCILLSSPPLPPAKYHTSFRESGAVEAFVVVCTYSITVNHHIQQPCFIFYGRVQQCTHCCSYPLSFPISCVYMRHLSLLSERSCIFLLPKRTLFSPPSSFQLSYLPMLAISTSTLPRLFFSGTFVSRPSPHHPPYPIGSLVAIILFVLFYSPAYGGHCKCFADRQR